ncbi:hypothetical protein [Pseudoalteromonas ruthenica]|uniref:hypothetical protein n=1 Tax=Pseudoalteromonas ruthenica TaxID=151081 RepID=UPI00110A56AB|nr:hypothetical protein [Pseudoalteromonas ruthenica]TMO97576.1 hypothetical protein CWC07_13930 [Pseudoalteromonas ruthenica]
MVFDITHDSLMTKQRLREKCGVSRNTLDKKLKEDPESPQPRITPLGEMYVTSEVNAWLTKYDSNLRTDDGKAAMALDVIAEGK